MKVIGYLACSTDCGEPLTLVQPNKRQFNDLPDGGVLMYDPREATLFSTREDARAAIKRTKRHFVGKAKLTGKSSILAEEKLYTRKVFAA
jgi:hypothetical protein